MNQFFFFLSEVNSQYLCSCCKAQNTDTVFGVSVLLPLYMYMYIMHRLMSNSPLPENPPPRHIPPPLTMSETDSCRPPLTWVDEGRKDVLVPLPSSLHEDTKGALRTEHCNNVCGDREDEEEEEKEERRKTWKRRRGESQQKKRWKDLPKPFFQHCSDAMVCSPYTEMANSSNQVVQSGRYFTNT